MNSMRRSGATLLVLLLVGCGAPSPGGSTPVSTAPAAILAGSAGPATAAPAAAAPATPSPEACHPGSGELWVHIGGEANLFGAGLERPPAPGGGGGGQLPPRIDLPRGGSHVVTFPCTGGATDPYGGPPTVGPAGYAGPPTDVRSFGGIAGLRLADRVMFLAGVFLSGDVPVGPAPDRLDFSGNTDFEVLEPQLGQTFYIGDGIGKQFRAARGSTRLYLGFVDAGGFVGEPGWYGNNRGALEATVRLTSE